MVDGKVTKYCQFCSIIQLTRFIYSSSYITATCPCDRTLPTQYTIFTVLLDEEQTLLHWVRLSQDSTYFTEPNLISDSACFLVANLNQTWAAGTVRFVSIHQFIIRSHTPHSFD